ncbi:MAG: carboxypeptidase regulatory-like domain-containing protein [Vicinamibacterales bacterium]
MKPRWFLALMVLAWCGTVATAGAQQPGEIFGKVTDASGAIVPGVTVTLTSPVLLRPLTAVTSETGSYRFPGLPVGTYDVKFELAGFKTVINKGIRIEIGFNAAVNATMEVSALEETVTVTGVSPLVDLRDTSKTARFTQEMLQSIPTARDPWVIIEQSPGVAMDRQNVGGSASGQQSNFVARGAQMSQQKWNLDGVDITDMAATGASPVYFDFDALEEMQVSTGGADVSMQSPGVAVNLVTKTGTDRLRGSGRYYVTDDSFEWNNVTDELRKQGVNTGNPIQNILDYGVEAGGPLRRGRAWFWGSYGRQDIDVGVNNFYLTTPRCQEMKKNPLAYSLKDIRTCLNTDNTLLNNYNAKLAVQGLRDNQFSFLFNGAEKVRNARDASDLRPPETTWRQMGVTRKDLGSSWWKTGMPKTYKWTDRHIFSDRFMLEVSFAHVGNNFTLTFQDESLRSVQPTYEITNGMWGRSYYEDVYVRPTDSLDVIGSYFAPGWLGGDHAFKFGFKYRDDGAFRATMYGGDAIARLRNGVPSEAQIYRRNRTESTLHNRNFYVQDSYTRDRLTLNLGFRVDFQTDEVQPNSVAASPFFGQPTFAGVYDDGGAYNGLYNGTYSGLAFSQLPAASFPGAKALGDKGLWFKDISPRLGVTYDLLGDGRNVVKFNYARYVGQLGGNSGLMSTRYNTLALTLVRYPWVDLNSDRVVQANEVVLLGEKGFAPLAYTSGYDYNDPGKTTTTGKVDPNLTNDYADEILLGFDKQVGDDIAMSAAYIWRKYQNFRWEDTLNWGSSDYRAVQWTPPASSCPPGSACKTVTYYEPTSQPPVGYLYTNRPDYWRGYQGIELSLHKRMSKNWLMHTGLSYNTSPAYYDSPAAYEDPTNILTSLHKAQYAEESTTSGLNNVFVNAKWIFRLSGSYTLPWYGIGVAGFYNSRSGYPFIRSVLSPNRPFSAGQAEVYIDKRGDVRLPTFQQIDLRVDKSFTLADRLRVTAAMDVFNLANANTALSTRGRQNASNANMIANVVAPRVIRFGVRVTF